MASIQVQVNDPRAVDALERALSQRARGRAALVRLTRGDAATLTGLPIEQAEAALRELVRRYRSHLTVTEAGELVYEFDPALERRDHIPLIERARAAGRLLYRGFSFLFKIWIVVTLVVYVLAFLAMMLSLLLVRQGDDRDDRRHHDDGGMFWLWWWLMPDWGPAPRDPYGRRRVRNRPQKRFYQAVFDFVFGPKRAPVDPREGDRRFLAFVRDQEGRVTTADLAALTGLSLDRAEEEMTRLLVEHDGEVEVAEDGTLLYVFDDVRRSAEKVEGGWSWAWQRPEPAVVLTGNGPGTNLAIGGFAGFNLFASLTIGPAFLARAHLAGEPMAQFLVTLFPLAFSLLFFTVPAARWGVAQRQKGRAARRQIRAELMRELWARPGEPVEPAAAVRAVTDRTGQAEAEVRRALDRLLAELDGDVHTDDDGSVRYRFPRLAEEAAAAAKARAAAPSAALGPVAFSSRDELGASGADQKAGPAPEPHAGSAPPAGPRLLEAPKAQVELDRLRENEAEAPVPTRRDRR